MKFLISLNNWFKNIQKNIKHIIKLHSNHRELIRKMFFYINQCNILILLFLLISSRASVKFIVLCMYH